MQVRKENVLVGTLILSLSSVFVRMIGFLFRVYLSNTIGAEGMGLYSLIMSLYSLCATVATSGISTAVSKLVAEELQRGSRANARRVLRRALMLSLTISVSVCAVLLLFSEPLALHVLKDARTALSLKLMAPGLPMLAMSASLRGYFIAKRQMGNPAAGQVLEQLCKMAFIIALMQYVLPMGLEYGCALVILGITLGEVVCLLITSVGFLWERRREPREGRATIKGATRAILGIAVPISVGSYVRSGLRLVEDVLIVSGFRTFGGEQSATGTYGMLRGMVMPLLLFPLSLLSAFVSTLTPEVSRLGAQNNPQRLEKAISLVLRYTCMIGIFIVGMFMTFGYELGSVVYRDETVGEMLRMMAFLVPFMCVETVVVGILQGLGEQVSSLRYNVSDCVLRIALVYFLIPRFGVNGFTVMVVASNLFTSLLNLHRLLKITHLRLHWREWVFRPALATAAAGQGCRLLYNYLPNLPAWLGLTVGIVLMGVLYLVLLAAIGGLRKGDFNWIVNRLRFSGKAPMAEPEPVM